MNGNQANNRKEKTMRKLLIIATALLTLVSTANAQELPACNSPEVIAVLARITNSTLNGILGPRALGANESKNFCTAAIGRWSAPFVNNQATYTVEWLDQANNKIWVQITGRLAR
jgi:hypothetical protein